MRKTFTFLTEHIKSVILFYIILQIIIIFTIPISYRSDSLNYYNLAQQCISTHSIYPAPEHLYEDYIIAPLYVNILIIVLSISNTVISISILNVCLNLLQLWMVYKLAEKLFDKNVAKMAVILYMFYLNSLGLILSNMTELIFNCFLLGSIYFYLKRDKKSFIISGLLAGASIGIRPIGWVLIVIYIVVVSCQLFRKNKNQLLVLAGAALFILIFGSITYLNFGDFIFTSTNGPLNILIGANKNATGAFNALVFEKGNSGYIDSLQLKTFYEKENYWKNQAHYWILNHPFKWISLFPMKIIHIFAWDDIALSYFIGHGRWNLYRVVKEILTTKSIKNVLLGYTTFEKILFLSIQFFHHLYYYFIVWMFYKFIIHLNKKQILREAVFISFGFIIVGLLINLMTFGDARYKYPYLILIIILISPKIHEYVTEIRFSKKVIKT